VALYRFDDPGKLQSPVLVAALDGWIDAGGASTTAAEHLAEGGAAVATFDGDIMFDYRSRRPTLDIVDGRLSRLDWPELVVRRAGLNGRDVLVLAGAEPDFRWHEFAASVVELVRRLGVVEWISLGAIPAAVPHTRPVPIIGSASAPGLLKGDVQPGPQGRLRVPSAALSVLEMSVADAGTPSLGYYAQVPHYVSGPYATAALELLRALGRHLGVDVPTGSLESEARELRSRLDLAAAADDTTRNYVERLEAMVDEERLPTGDELISDIERFLRDRGGEGTQRS
jgi:proteasome assembly chaperone (PAC2) family protein